MGSLGLGPLCSALSVPGDVGPGLPHTWVTQVCAARTHGEGDAVMVPMGTALQLRAAQELPEEPEWKSTKGRQEGLGKREGGRENPPMPGS